MIDLDLFQMKVQHMQTKGLAEVLRDVFRDFFGDAGSPLEIFLICFWSEPGRSGSSTKKRRRQERGEDIHVVMNLRLEEILYDVKKMVEYNRYVICESCKGTGAEKWNKF